MLKYVFAPIFFLVIGFSAKAQCSAATSLATPYDGNTGHRGAMFDITATNDVVIRCFDAHIYNGPADYEIYYKPGSYVGSETNPADWTYIGNATALTPLGAGVPTPIPIAVNVIIHAGETYGFYITNTISGGLRYTNATGVSTLATDANISITGGIGKAYPFMTTFLYRLVNATAHYNLGTALPVQLISFSAEMAPNELVELKWSTSAEINNDYFIAERSKDGLKWEEVKKVTVSGNSFSPRNYAITDNMPYTGVSYYRLKQTDIDGQVTYFTVKEVSRSKYNGSKLFVYPNPGKDLVTVKNTIGKSEPIVVCDAIGHEVTSWIKVVSNEETGTILDISGLADGFYIIKTITGVGSFYKN